MIEASKMFPLGLRSLDIPLNRNRLGKTLTDPSSHREREGEVNRIYAKAGT